MKLIKAIFEEKNDILNLFFEDFKISFRYSSFFNDCYNGHITSKFTGKQFVVKSELKNKHLIYTFISKDIKFSVFKYDLENKLRK